MPTSPGSLGLAKDDDSIGMIEAMTLRSPSAWVLSTSWFGRPTGTEWPVPRNWHLVDTHFEEEPFFAEGPIVVWHYHIDVVRNRPEQPEGRAP